MQKQDLPEDDKYECRKNFSWKVAESESFLVETWLIPRCRDWGEFKLYIEIRFVGNQSEMIKNSPNESM